jgi:hypothetical protein
MFAALMRFTNEKRCDPVFVVTEYEKQYAVRRMTVSM